MLSLDSVTGEENYIEIVLAKKCINEHQYEIDFTDDECEKIIVDLLNHYPQNKFFKKHTTKYLYDSLEMNIYNIDNTKTVYNSKFIRHTVHKKHKLFFLTNFYDKKLLPNHAFPSTTDIDDIIDSKRITMKITNNIYFNIDSLQYSDNTTATHIFINMNIKKSNDILHTTDTVNEIISLLDA